MPEQISEIEASLLLRNSKDIGKAKEILSKSKYPKGAATAITAIGSGLTVYAIADLQGSLLIKAIIGGSLGGLLGVFVEQWSVRRRLEAAIQLVISHEERMNSQPSGAARSEASA